MLHMDIFSSAAGGSKKTADWETQTGGARHNNQLTLKEANTEV